MDNLVRLEQLEPPASFVPIQPPMPTQIADPVQSAIAPSLPLPPQQHLPSPPVIRRSHSFNALHHHGARLVVPFIPLDSILNRQPPDNNPQMITLRRSPTESNIRSNRKRMESILKRVSVTLSDLQELQEGDGGELSVIGVKE